MRVAIVTPYYQEPFETLKRCVDSVQAQTHRTWTHYLVADGHPHHGSLRALPGTHWIDLPVSHRNYGNTPRGIGAACALADGMDVVCFLDADNLVLPDHLASLVSQYQQAAAMGQPLDAAFARRCLFPAGHEQLLMVSEEDVQNRHVDTSCISLARSAAFLWTAWAAIPDGAAPVCDRVMFRLMQHHRLRVSWVPHYTVLYESRWAATYQQAGLPVPAAGLHDSTLDGLSERFSAQQLWTHLRLPWPDLAPDSSAQP